MGTATITPDDASAGGTFTPTTVGLTNASRTATFTYTPAAPGTDTISTTNDAGLTDPPALSYVSLAAVTAYTLTGPATVIAGKPTTSYTVTLGAGTLVGTVTITPGGGGVFTPTTVVLTNTVRSGTFVVTEAVGSYTIVTTNSGGLSNPAGVALVASPAPVTLYTLTGPSTGSAGSPSTNFTVTLGSGALAGTIVITPHDGGSGGTFQPTSISLTNTVRSGTFTVNEAAGTFSISTTNSASLTNPSPIAYVASVPGSGTTYYVAPIGTSGAGTLSNPWGIPDLYNPSTFAAGVAMTTPVAGDTVYFRGGTYHVNSKPTGAFQNVLLLLSHSGTSGHPITLASYPGETPIFSLESGMAALFGTSPSQNSFGDLSYVRYIGLTVNITATFDNPATPGFTNSPRAFSMGGTNNEIGYCKIVGCNVTTGDNHEGIFFSAGLNGTNNWVHHCDLSGFTNTGNSHNSSGLKVYAGKVLLVEDNYFHGNTVGIYDKDAGGTTGTPPDGTHTTTYRRNYVTGSAVAGWLGTNQGSQATYLIYDNVIGNVFQLSGYQTGTQIYNNLLPNLGNGLGAGPTVHGYIGFQGLDPQFYLGQFWNNVINCNPISGPVQTQVSPFYSGFNTFTTGLSTSPIAYMDYNIYTATPWYVFIGTVLNWAAMQGQGFELRAQQVASITSVYVDTTNYVLRTSPTNWTTAGRYSDQVGPRVPIGGPGGIMDTTRYGPAAQP